MIGQQILNYKIEKLISEGGMGKVYLGKHLQLNRKVAIKVLHPHLIYSQEFRSRFHAEANLLAQLKHPNIVTLYDYYESTDFLALILEYVEGITMEDYLKKNGYIAQNQIISLFQQVLDAFEYAHGQGIIHRDIKPANIMLQDSSEGLKVKILDFGIAKIKDNLTKTQTGTQMGTILYMSPEQVKGQKVDVRSDIYSLGVTLFELATGKMPFNPNSSIYEISNAIVHLPLPKPRTIKPDISPLIESAILKATEKNPDLRFQNCSEFKQALSPKPSSSRNSLWSFQSIAYILLVIVALFFLFFQIYENFTLKNNILSQENTKNDTASVTDSSITPSGTNNTASDPNSQMSIESDGEPLPPIEFTELVEGQKIISILNECLEKINRQEDFMDFLDYKVNVNQQELTQEEAYNKLKKFLKWDIVKVENSKVTYEKIGELKIFSQASNSKEYLSFATQNLKIRRNEKVESADYTAFEDFDLVLVFKNKDFKIIQMDFK